MPTRTRRILARCLAGFALLVLGFALWVGWYASSKGFTKKWRRFVVEEFRKRGAEVSFARLTVDPFQGLVARDFKVYSTTERGRVVGRVNRIVLDINYANLIHGEPFLNAVDLRDANLALPLDPAREDSPVLSVKGLDARLLFPPHQIYLSRAHARVQGIALSASGRLINPEAFRPAPAGAQRPLAMVEKVLQELDSLKIEGRPPRLTIHFAGDLANPDALVVEAALEAGNVRRGAFLAREISAAAQYRNRSLTLTHLRIADETGELQARGQFDTTARTASVLLHSTLDFAPLLGELGLGEKLKDVDFQTAPELDLEGHAVLGDAPTFSVLGSATVARLAMRAVELRDVRTSFSWDGARWYLRNLHATHTTGELGADLMLDGDGFHGKLRSSLDPTIALPFLSGNTAKFVSEWSFPHSPEIQLVAKGPGPDPDVLEIEGSLRLGHAEFRGVGVRSGSARVHTKDRAATYSDCRVERDEGSATGTFVYDFGRKLVRMEKVRSTLDPQTVAVWLAWDFPKHIAPYRFNRPPTLRIDGTVFYKGDSGTKLTVLVDAPQGMDYDFLKKTLPFTRVSGKLLFTDGHLALQNLTGRLYGGAVSGGADISLDKKNQDYSGRVAIEQMDFASLTNLYFDYDSSTGLMAGDFDFSGRGSDPHTLEGRGSVHVVDGNIFAIPCLGPLSGILDDIVPGMGVSIAREASSTFTLANGVIATDDFKVQGKGFEMLGDGQIFFLADRMKFDIRINARGVPGVLLFPVSKLFEYTSTGSLSSPEWRPKMLPSFSR